MRVLIATIMCSALLAVGLASSPGCFDPKLPDVAFQCGENDECPEDYECRDDGCCHRIGSPLDDHGPCAPEPDAGTTADASA